MRRSLLVLSLFAARLLIPSEAANAGHFSACDTKTCRPNADEAYCGREIHWRARRAKLLMAWDTAGNFLFVQRELSKPLAAVSGDDEAQKSAALEKELESSFNSDAKSDAFRVDLVDSFNKDVAITKKAAAAIAVKVASLCSRYSNTLLGKGVIVATTPQSLSQQAEIAGMLHFCRGDVSVRYMQFLKSSIWLKMQDNVINFERFETTAKQSDGHHANLVSFSYDLGAPQGSAVARMSLTPYFEFQFGDRNEQSFNASTQSKCDVEDAAAIELMTQLGFDPKAN